MKEDVKQQAGARLVNLATEAGLKGCILITFESGCREVLRHSSTDEFEPPLRKVAEAIHNDMENGDIIIPEELD